VARGRTLGAITFVRGDSGRRYHKEDVAVAEELARRAALSIDDARLYAQAKEAVHEREEFLSIASHELRGPLTPLQLQLQMMLRSARAGQVEYLQPERLVAKLESCERHTKRLGRLIHDLLDVSRINAGRLSLDLVEVELAALLRDTVARVVADGAHGTMAPAIEVSAVPCVGRWDRGRLEQVVTNLLDNALRYGRGKPIRVSLTRRPIHERPPGQDAQPGQDDVEPVEVARLQVADRGQEPRRRARPGAVHREADRRGAGRLGDRGKRARCRVGLHRGTALPGAGWPLTADVDRALIRRCRRCRR
jgi:signal transduction histidine kinase